VAETSDIPAKQLPTEQREGVARALAGAIEQLTQVGKYEPPFSMELTVTLTDANGRTWSAAVTASDLTSVLSSPSMQPATNHRAKKFSELSRTARKTADELELLQEEMRAQGVALQLVRFREAHGERGAIVDLNAAAGTLRAYAAILESNVRMAAMRERKAAKAGVESQDVGVV
jgi:hypothetical protein